MDHVTSPDLDRLALAEVLEIDDRLGVLSLYVHADPSVQAAGRPAWEVALRNELAAIRRAARDAGPRDRWRALEDRLAGLADDVARLLDPAEPGRGRALFAPLAGDLVHRVTLQTPLPTAAVLQERPYVRPLVAALDHGRPTGVVAVSKADARIADLRLGRLSPLLELPFQAATGDWREMKGPAGANPAMAQQTAPQHDRYARRVGERRRRFLVSVAGRVAELAREERWERIAVAGDGRLTGPLLEELAASSGTTVVPVGRPLDGLAPHELGEAVDAALAPWEEERRGERLRRARADALAGGAGAVGTADVLAALEQGRVAVLILAADAPYRGLRGGDGRLHAPDAGSLAGGAHTPEPLLGERMVELAIRTDAEILTLRGAAADELAAAGGVVAGLRW